MSTLKIHSKPPQPTARLGEDLLFKLPDVEMAPGKPWQVKDRKINPCLSVFGPGPVDVTCKSCIHFRRIQYAKVIRKCARRHQHALKMEDVRGPHPEEFLQYRFAQDRPSGPVAGLWPVRKGQAVKPGGFNYTPLMVPVRVGPKPGSKRRAARKRREQATARKLSMQMGLALHASDPVREYVLKSSPLSQPKP